MWKYVAWMLPVAILYGAFYLLFKFELLNHWWTVPTVIMQGASFYASTALAIYLIVEDK